jgi:hypothetical protein
MVGVGVGAVAARHAFRGHGERDVQEHGQVPGVEDFVAVQEESVDDQDGPVDGGFTLRGTVSDRLGNNIVHLAINTIFLALVGWGAAALTAYLVRRASTSAIPPSGGPIPEA